MCVDYRRLNAVTVPDRFPLPNLSDAVFSLHGVKYFSSLDLVRGYYQLPLSESSREYTAFSTPHNHWQFKRLSFGLRNAPSAFQREMQHVLSGFPWRKVVVYIDDVLIMSETFQEHLTLLGRVLSTLEAHGVNVKLSKCSWVASEVEYLGHVVGADGIRKPDSYVKKVDEIPRPTTVRGLREFLGLANFQRKFVPNFSVIQRPLSEKTGGRGTRKLQWTEDMEVAFLKLKEKIREDVRLSYPDYSPEAEPLEIYVDASASGAGACLCQKQGDDTRIIAYASTSFGSAEVNYSTIEKELAALRWGVKTFRPFLIGVEFVIHTDHQPLIYLNNMTLIDSRLARTLEDLADFNFEIRYTPGTENAAADCLSRLYDPNHIHPHLNPGFDSAQLPEVIYVYDQMPGGGNSLFDSLSLLSERALLVKDWLSPLRLREVLVDELFRHSDWYGIKLNKQERKKLKLMRCSSQLPSTEILFAFGEIYTCIVFVHFGGLKPIGYYSPRVDISDTTFRVHLQCLSGIHYNPAYETPLFKFSNGTKSMKPTSGDSLSPPCDDQTLTEVSADCVEAEVLGADFRDLSLREWCSRHPRTHATAVLLRLGESLYCALIDTGAQVSCISDTTATSLSLDVDASVKYIITGFGSRSSPSVGVVELAIGLTQGVLAPHSLQFVVVDQAMMPFCLILGADYLALHGI